MNTRKWMVVGAIGLAQTGWAQCQVGEQGRFEPLDLAPGDRFGGDVYISGSRVVIGAHRHDHVFTDSGAAYVFDINTGEQLHKLVPDDPQESAWFGRCVCISGDWMAVGAHRADDDAGAVYIFDAVTGQQVRKLVGPDRAPDDNFGWEVRIEGNIAAIGAFGVHAGAEDTGAVYTYDLTNGQLLRMFVPSDVAAGDGFGNDVAIHGNLLLVGATDADAPARNSGAAYLFDVSTGQELRKFIAEDGTQNDWLGGNVDFNENHAVITATGDYEQFRDGSAYFFDLHTGQQLAKFRPQGLPFVQFGASATVSGSVALIGDASAHGYCFAYEIPTARVISSFRTTWPSTGIALGQYGFIDGDRVVLGAIADDSACPPGEDCNSGAAFLFTLPPDLSSCPAELNNDCSLDFFDVQTFLNAFVAQDALADFNDDGVYDFADVQAYLNAYSAGCP